MTAIKANDVDGALRRLGPPIVAVLLYGPDTGLVAERAKAAAERAVDDPADPFQLIRLDGDTVAGDPARLADEAGTIGLFGSRRAIWVRGASRNLAPAVAPVLDMPVGDTLVVIEAGDLAKSAPLRTLCERSPKALALPCYGDADKALETIVDEALRAAKLSIAKDARAALIASLGGDRLATRGEIAKLALYVHGKGEVTIEDVDAIMSDVSSLAMDAVVDAAFGGDRARLDQSYRRLAAEGAAPSVILGAALRHAMSLLAAKEEVAAGRSAEEALRPLRLNFRRVGAVQKQLARWSGPNLARAVARLQGAVLESRRRADVAEAVAAHALFAIAGGATWK